MWQLVNVKCQKMHVNMIAQHFTMATENGTATLMHMYSGKEMQADHDSVMLASHRVSECTICDRCRQSDAGHRYSVNPPD